MDETAQAPDGQSSPQEPNRTPAIGPDKPVSERSEAKQKPSAQQNLERRFSIFEGWMIALTILGVAVAAITGVIFWKQLGVMAGQLSEMKSGGVDTHELAVAAKKQAAANVQQVGSFAALAIAAKKQSDDTSTLAKATSDEVRKMQALTKATQDAVTVNREALESVQRAFLSFAQSLEIGVVPDAADRQKIRFWEFRPRLENSGTTPTRRAIHRMNWMSMANLPDAFDFADLVADPPTPFVVGPHTFVTGATVQIPPALLELVRNHTVRLYFWGWTTYRDIFQRTALHIAMFCNEMTEVRGPDTGITGTANQVNFLWRSCGRHNCTDEECEGQTYEMPARPWHHPAPAN